MARQSEYLASLLSPADAAADSPQATRRAGTTLLSRETALARVNSGEVRQVTQLLLDPARVRIWAGNARIQAALSEANCRDLIDSILAEGGQRVPTVVRRLESDPDHDYELIAGTRRHFAISWLRAHAYPDMQLLAQVQNLDDEAAFRLADLENRARKDISDIERARNYAAALDNHYEGHLTRMADRLRVSKGWLSKMLKVARLPDAVVNAFGSLFDIPLKPAYALAQAMDDKGVAIAVCATAERIIAAQADRRRTGLDPLPGSDVMKQLLAAPALSPQSEARVVINSRLGRPLLSVQSCNRQGATLRLHAASGALDEEVIDAVKSVLSSLRERGQGGYF